MATASFQGRMAAVLSFLDPFASSGSQPYSHARGNGSGFCPNPVQPVGRPRSFLFSSDEKTSASLRGCRSVMLRMVSICARGLCGEAARLDQQQIGISPEARSAHCSDHGASPACNGRAWPRVPAWRTPVHWRGHGSLSTGKRSIRLRSPPKPNSQASCLRTHHSRTRPALPRTSCAVAASSHT